MDGCDRSGMCLYMPGFVETIENKNEHTSQFASLKKANKQTNG